MSEEGSVISTDETLKAILDEQELEYERPREGAYLVKLPGRHKLATMAWIMAGEHSLQVEAFFCRQPDENREEFYRWLLGKNGGMYGVGFALDEIGDVYLVGRLPLSAVTAKEIDRILGCVLTYSDDNFDRALELGFAGSIRREWDWRIKRGESVANLRPFARILPEASGEQGLPEASRCHQPGRMR